MLMERIDVFNQDERRLGNDRAIHLARHVLRFLLRMKMQPKARLLLDFPKRCDMRQLVALDVATGRQPKVLLRVAMQQDF